MPIQAQLHDGRILEFPDGTDPKVIQATVKKVLGVAPETTVLGQVGEAFKGLVPGAVGLVESAAVGASALLPEEQERAAREAIARIAGAAKAPFAPAPGYEQAVGRKLGEAVGSTAPFLIAGPLGLAGRAAAVGLGVGAGAGEARTRAETEGATAEQRGTATALGTIPGALEVFAPFRILSRIPEGEVLGAVARVRRALVAGGEEAAQEAASGLAQNMIARGVYKPDQALIEGLGEQAAYGGATGAIVQGLMDLALGRRARGAGGGAEPPAPIDVARQEAAKKEAERAAATAAAAPPPVPSTQAIIDDALSKPVSRAFAQLTQAIEELKQQPASPQRNAAIKELEAERGRREREDAERVQAGKKVAEGFLSPEEAAAQAVTPRGEFDPTQARREEIERLRAERETLLVKGKPPALKSPARRKFDELDARLVEIGGGRWTPTVAPPAATEPTTPTVEEPAAPAVGLTEQDIFDLGITKRQPIFKRMLGKEPTDTSVLDDIEDYLNKGHGSEESRTKLAEFRDRFAPKPAEAAAPAEPPPPEAAAPVEPAAPAEPPPPVVTKLTRQQLEDLAEQVERVSGRMTEEEYNAYVKNHVDKSGNRIKPGAKHIRAVQELLKRYGAEPPPPEAAAPTPPETPSAVSIPTEPATSGASVPVAGGPAAVSPTEGPGAVEPVRVVPPTEDVGQPVAGEGEQPAAVSTTNTPQSDALMDEIRALEQQRMALLTKNGRIPAAKSPARKKYDELVDTIAQKKEQWAQMTRPQRGPVETAPAPAPAPEPPDYTEFTYGELEDALKKANQTNLDLDVAAIRKYVGDKAADAYLAMSSRQQDKWWSENATEPMEREGSPFKGVDTERIQSFIDAYYAFSTESPQQMGESIALLLRKVKDPNFKKSPEFVTARNAFSYAQGMGWDLQEVRKSAQKRAGEWAGRNVEELFGDLFKPRPAATSVPTAPALTAPAPAPTPFPEPQFRQTRFVEADLRNSKEMDDALRGKSFMEAIDYAILNSRDDLDRAVMVKVKRRAEELASMGAKFSFELTRPGMVLGGARGVARTNYAFAGKNLSVEVTVNGYTGFKESTLRQETLVHELIHAVTVAQIRFSPQGSAGMKLKALHKELVPKFKAQRDSGALDYRQTQLFGNALADPYELITYGLVNADFQNWLASTPSPTGGTFLSRFFDLVSQILKLNSKESSALAELMTISEGVFDESLAPVVEEAKRQRVGFVTSLPDRTAGEPTQNLYHRSSMPALLAVSAGDIITLNPGPQGAEGPGVYFSEGRPVKSSTAEGTKNGKETGVIEIAKPSARGWWRSKGNKAEKFGKPRTWHTEGKSLSLRVTNVREENGVRIVTATPESDWVQTAGESTTSADLVTPQTEAATADVDVIGKESEKGLADILKKNPALAARIKATDYLAGLDDPFVKAYAGKVRDAVGNLNPMIKVSRALDHERVALEAMRIGGLKIKDGLIQATELTVPEDSKEFPLIAGKTISYQKNVIERLVKEAKQAKKPFEEYRTQVDTVLYGHREYNLRKHNRQVEAQAQALEAAGKQKQADKLREDQTIELFIKDDAKLDELEAEFQRNTGIQEISQTLDAIRFNNLDVLVQTNRLSPEKAQEYKDNIGYIPFKRIVEYEAGFDTAKGGNRGIAALKNIRKLEGSSRQSLSVVENFAGFMDWATRESMMNDASLSALKDMELLKLARKGANKEPGATGANVDVYDKGERVSYYVPDPAHVIAFTFQPAELSSVFKGMQKASNILRAGVTAMPPFAVKQIFDDIVRAYTNAGVKHPMELTARILTNFPANWYREAFGKTQNATVREMAKLGIFGTFDFTRTGNVRNILQESGAEKGKVKALGRTIMRVMEAGAKASDISVRQAIYEQVLKETGDPAAAESRAREIINFSRRGSSGFMNTMIAVVPFFNAYARGMDKLAVAAAGKVVGQSTGQARSMFYKRMGVMTAMGLAYAFMMSDDDEYNALPDHVRDTNWILPYGKYLGFTPGIPIPAELAFFFKAIPERVVRYYKLQGTDEEKAAIEIVGNLLKRGVDVFSSPNVTPQMLRPFIENITNYSWFLGRPLESQGQLALDPFQRFGTGTSEFAKVSAEALEQAYQNTGIELLRISPIKIENAIRGILGTTAGVALAMTDAFINPTRTDRPLHQMLGAQLTGASAVMKDAVGTRYIDSIYDLEKDVNRVNSTYNRLLEREPEKVDEYLRDNIGLLSIRPAVSSLMKAIKELNNQASIIDRATDLTKEERRTLINQLRAQQNELAQQSEALRTQARRTEQGL